MRGARLMPFQLFPVSPRRVWRLQLERHSRPRGGEVSRRRGVEGRGLDGGGVAEREGQGLGPGGARHDDLLFAAHGAQEALELELEGLRFRRLEPDVLHDLLERGRAEALPARLQPEEVPAALGQVERAVTGRLEDPELRVRSRETRLAVRFAMAPLANSM